uniref:Uncharacterized protein n=1 Tax=Physcomitrium patens TaxID=3218 RepID=A0A2K1IJA3_PHYPA|nr:hypothetical protein PHYPA_028047 [Physcomitrium patens]
MQTTLVSRLNTKFRSIFNLTSRNDGISGMNASALLKQYFTSMSGNRYMSPQFILGFMR